MNSCNLPQAVSNLLTNKWGKDPLSDLMTKMFLNQGETFLLHPDYFNVLKTSGEIFRDILTILAVEIEEDEMIPRTISARAFYYFNTASILSCSALWSESFTLMRAMIECVSYCFYIKTKPKLATIWLNRHQSQKDKKKCQNEFKIGDIFQEIEKKSKKIMKSIKDDYNSCIDYGGHPNERAVFPSTRIDDQKITVCHFIEDSNLKKACILKIGLIFTNIFELFKLTFTEIASDANLDIRVQNLKLDMKRIAPVPITGLRNRYR